MKYYGRTDLVVEGYLINQEYYKTKDIKVFARQMTDLYRRAAA